MHNMVNLILILLAIWQWLSGIILSTLAGLGTHR